MVMHEHDGFEPQSAVRTGLPDDNDAVLLQEAGELLQVHRCHDLRHGEDDEVRGSLDVTRIGNLQGM